MTNSRLLGSVHLEKKGGLLYALKESPLIERIRYGSDNKLDKQIKRVSSEVSAVCRYNDISEFAFMTCGSVGENVVNNLQIISDDLNSQGVTNLVTDIKELRTDDKLKTKHVLFVIQNNITKIKEIRTALEEASAFHLGVIGFVYYD